MTARTAEQSHTTKGLVRLTMACNERCPFCNVPAEDFPTTPAPDSALEQAAQQTLAAGGQTLTLSGGEPTLLRGRLLRWVRRARALGVPLVELQTNAVLIDDTYAQELAQAGLTSAFVSLLSDDPALHDSLAGLEGAWPRTLRGIDALLDAGVRVTLNPVVAASTQDRLARYVAFVLKRLPRVRSVSLSAVQPHGRAARHPELVPDYRALAGAVREARRLADAGGIELLNPYCGLPLCVGWAEAQDRCVEALVLDSSAPGVENQGDKSQGPPCRACALRTRCGGAWHAVWRRPDPGLAPPLRKTDPWDPAGADPGAQAVERAPSATPEALAALARRPEPTRWLWLEALLPGDAARLHASACTDLALALNPQDRGTLRELRGLLRAQAGAADPARLRVVVGWDARAQRAETTWTLCSLLAAMGADGLRPRGLDPATARRFARGLPSTDLEVY